MTKLPGESQNIPRIHVRVMTFNVRFDTPTDAPENTWQQRRDAAAEVVRLRAPDVVGLQEALEHQFRDMEAALPGYAFLGRGRELEGKGEFVPLAYRRDRFELDQWGVFWLSEQPEIEGSRGWDADAPRICTWAVLRDAAAAGRLFFAANTHLDRWGAVARERSAELLVLRMSRFAGLPAVVTGDLNATEDDPPFKILAGAMLRDSYRDVDTGPAPPTMHHYGGRLGGKIDFVLCDPNWRVLGAEVVRDRPFGRWPSDHYPVVADLELDEPAP